MIITPEIQEKIAEAVWITQGFDISLVEYKNTPNGGNFDEEEKQLIGMTFSDMIIESVYEATDAVIAVLHESYPEDQFVPDEEIRRVAQKEADGFWQGFFQGAVWHRDKSGLRSLLVPRIDQSAEKAILADALKLGIDGDPNRIIEFIQRDRHRIQEELRDLR